jgi:hypothetical protein
VFDNSVDDVEPRIIFRTRSGHVEKVYHEEIPVWTGEIMEALYAHDVRPPADRDR